MSWRLRDPRFLKLYIPLRNTAADWSGHGTNGTWTGTEAYAEGPFNGHSVGVFSAGNYITTPAITIGSQWTLSAWVLFTALGAQVNFLECGAVGDLTSMALLYKTGANVLSLYVLYDSGVGVDLSSGVTIVTNQWYHVIGVNDGVTRLIYVNGVYANSGATASPITPNKVCSIGARANGTIPLVGRDFSTRIYSCALTYDEVLELNKLDRRT